MSTEEELGIAYITQVKDLAKLALEWLKAHPRSDAKIQFNFPAEVGLIATVGDAIKRGFVSVNPEGMKLLEHMGAMVKGPKTPTVFMVRMAMEFIEKEDQ